MPAPQKTAAKAAVEPAKYQMPTPPAVVVWRNAPGGEPNYAVVTKVGRQAVSLMIFPTDSRVGVPKDGVRFVGDPDNRHLALSDAGVWDYTDESKLLQKLAGALAGDTN